MKKQQKNNSKNINTSSGITLIALVITIIVLVILAGIAINAIVGNNGVVTKAIQSKEKTAVAKEKEKIALAYSEYEIADVDFVD